MRAPFFCFLTGLLAPVLALAAVAPARGQPLPPLPVPPPSAARDPDAICAAALGGAFPEMWMLCRNPTGEEAAGMARRASAHPYYRFILLARYGGERMADLATAAATAQYRRLSNRQRDRQVDACVARAQSRR